ncbi:DUF7619 domain-containing protein [Hanstruepera ponticola]|uniref:DUF7619 domain-containing protein n=1 Tax=Hanstruepera ponticola TaxID=2042995 RepID=UPI00177EBB37|nr:T9SS type A sorting domain-containing protein [Hanstruepera ponticola]
MKHFYLFLFTVLFSISTQSQIVDIPDENFKNALINSNCVSFDYNFPSIIDVDLNNDGEIQLSEAQSVEHLRISDNFDINNMIGIESFTNLLSISIRNNPIQTVDFSSNINLTEIICANNPQLQIINFGSNTNLIGIDCSNNSLTYLDLESVPNLEFLYCYNNQLNSLNISSNLSLRDLTCYENPLTDIDTSSNALLTSLVIGDNPLSTIDLSSNTEIISLTISGNVPLSSLDLSNNINLTHLALYNSDISNLDLSNNINLLQFIISGSQQILLDLTNNTNLEELRCSNMGLSELDLSNNINLNELICNNNSLTSLDLSQNLNLEYLQCNSNELATLDLSNNSSLRNVEFVFNPLTYVNIKNGNNENLASTYVTQGLDNLEAICVDNMNSNIWDYYSQLPSSPNITEYCSFIPGGEYYIIEGQANIDLDTNGCGASDVFLPNLNLQISNSTESGAFFTNDSGTYFMPVPTGNHTITPLLENPTYFSINPSDFNVSFPSDASPFIQDFCLTPNGDFNDLEISIVPLVVARPGFEAEYKIIYKNKGTTTLTGSVDFNYDDDYMDLLNTSPIGDTQTIGNLSWEYSDLLPFETREILVTMSLNTPTDSEFPLNGDDVLEFDATINPSGIDETPEDNNMILNQVVVNSYDPNDKTCLQGAVVTPEQVGKYVHYVIRFENTGTANAVNVVVKDVIDTLKYDLNSLVPLYASHDFYTKIRNESEVEFIFENIQLPFDDANNDGYVVFKIKTLPSLVVGDTFSNEAQIYFDFNYPIITNNETTIIQESLSIHEYNANNSLNVFPNPTNDYFEIYTQNNLGIESIDLIDLSGKTIKQFKVSEKYSIEEIASGIYFVKIRATKSETIKKLIKI